jgi:hypothetical protein
MASGRWPLFLLKRMSVAQIESRNSVFARKMCTSSSSLANTYWKS